MRRRTLETPALTARRLTTRWRERSGLTLIALAVVLAAAALAALAATAAAPPNLDRALAAQRALSTQRPQDPAVWNDLGNLLLLANQPQEAEAAYRRAVELDPKKASALFNLGLLEQQQGKLRDAMSTYERVLEIDPRHAWAHFQIGSIHERRGEKSRAIKAYAEAFALDSQLALPEVNPSVIGSKLVMESMLRAYKRGMATDPVRHQYDDPTRIASLLVQAPAQAAQDEAKAAPAADPAAGTKVLTPGSLAPGSNVGQALPAGQKGGRPGAPGTAGYAAPGYAPPGPGYPTYITPGTGAAVPGAAVPGVPGQQWARPQPRYPNPDGTQPGAVLNPPPGGTYYRPAVPSTGQLSTTVLPNEG